MDLAELLASLKPRNAGRAGASRRWYDVGNLSAGGEAEIYIYDYMGFDPWFGGVSAQEFVRELKGLNASTIKLRINSPGGDITEANAIRTALAEHPATIETHVDGLAASSASWVGLVADKVVMSPHAMLMIHEPWNVVMGDAAAFEKEAEVLNRFGTEIAEMLAEKAGGSVDEWRDRMRAETWYGDQEAVDAGLADEVAAAPDGAQNARERRWDASILALFRNTPAALLEPAKRPKQRGGGRTQRSDADERGPHPEAVRATLEHLREQSRRFGVAV